jgi:Transcription elongation factor Elf1 like
MERKLGIGFLTCKVCGQSFQAPLNHLTQPIDIYCEWVDATELINKKYPNGATTSGTIGEEDEVPASVSNPLRAKLGNARGGQDSYANRTEGGDFVVADDDDAEGEFIDDD